MKPSVLSASLLLLAGASGLYAIPAVAQEAPIQVVSAAFGPAKSMRPTDFTQRLTQICGANAHECQGFCTRAAVGYRPGGPSFFFPPRMICRVTYRCGYLQTKVTDADENDTFSLSCPPRP